MRRTEVTLDAGETADEMQRLFYRVEKIMQSAGISFGMTMSLYPLQQKRNTLLITLPFSKRKEALKALEANGLIPLKVGETND